MVTGKYDEEHIRCGLDEVGGPDLTGSVRPTFCHYQYSPLSSLRSHSQLAPLQPSPIICCDGP